MARRAFSQPGKGEPQKLASSRATDLRQAPAKTENLTGPRTTCRNEATGSAGITRGKVTRYYYSTLSLKLVWLPPPSQCHCQLGIRGRCSTKHWQGDSRRPQEERRPGGLARGRFAGPGPYYSSIASLSASGGSHRDATGTVTASGSWLNRRPVASKTVTRDSRDTV